MKIMKINQLIQQLIQSSHSPVDFEQIMVFLATQNIKPNKTTIYRNLDKLQKDGTINKVILSDQKQFWEIVHNQTQNNHQHFHLICNICTKIECQELPNFPNFNLSNLGFKIQKTEINLFGLCQDCVII